MTKARGDQPDTNADLSEAARAVVRDAGDPRIDAHLAALGLGPDPAPAVTEPRPVAPGAPVVDPVDLEALRHRVGELEAALAAAHGQVRRLAMALLAVVLVAGVIVLLLLASRPG